MRKIYFLVLIFVVITGCASQKNLTENKSEKLQSGTVKELRINAYNFGFTQTPIQINKGDTVKLILTSSSGVHGIAIPAFGVNSGPVTPNGEVVVEFTADKEGSFEYFCNIPCGDGHKNMRGQIIVK